MRSFSKPFTTCLVVNIHARYTNEIAMTNNTTVIQRKGSQPHDRVSNCSGQIAIEAMGIKPMQAFVVSL